jgi:hypothetical protein
MTDIAIRVDNLALSEAEVYPSSTPRVQLRAGHLGAPSAPATPRHHFDGALRSTPEGQDRLKILSCSTEATRGPSASRAKDIFYA